MTNEEQWAPQPGQYLYDEEHPRVEGERWGASVLNDPENLTPQALRLKQAGNAKEAQIEALPWGMHEVEEPLRPYSIIPEYRIVHQTPDGPGEFDGWFIAEEAYGGWNPPGTHPRLLLAPDRVLKRDTPKTIEDLMAERQQ